jgi:hypothetical protein
MNSNSSSSHPTNIFPTISNHPPNMPSPVHLVVLVHGLWGQSSHLSVLEEELLAHHPSAVDASSPLVHLDPPSPSSSASSRPNPRDAQIVVLNVKGNSGDKTSVPAGDGKRSRGVIISSFGLPLGDVLEGIADL